MNILFLSELFYPHGSGGELATYLYAKLLSEAGINVIVITNRFAGESDVSKEGKLTVYRLPLLKRGGSIKYSILQRFDVLSSSFMRKLIKWADLVYIPKFWYSAIPFAKAYGKPVVTHLHGYFPICPLSNCYDLTTSRICNRSLSCSPKCIYTYEKNQEKGLTETLTSVVLNSTLRPYFSRFMKLVDAVICVSKAQQEILIRHARSLSPKIHVIYNPLPDVSYLDIEGDDFGYFSGPSPLKGFHVLSYALTYAQACASVKTLKVHVTNLNIRANNAKWLNQRGIIAYKRLDETCYEKLYRRIRSVVVPSIWPETYGYVACEALLRGRIVIASAIGGIPEVVEGCPGAFLFRAGDYIQLADKMTAVKNLSRETVADLGARNRETIQKKFSDDKILRMFVDVLTKIAD